MQTCADESEVIAQFGQAVGRLRATPLEKLFLVGPVRFATRYLARVRREPTTRRANLFFGQPMTVVLPEVISEQIYSYGFFDRSEEHTSELQSRRDLVCRLLLEKKK